MTEEQYVSETDKQNMEVILETQGDESVRDFTCKSGLFVLEPGFAAEDCTEQ